MAIGTGGAIRAGRAFVELFADDARLIKTLRQNERRLKLWGAMINRVGAGVAAMGTAALAPLLGMTQHFASVGDSLDKMALRSGASVEFLSAIGFAAEQSGSSLESVNGALFRMRRRVANAATGGGPAVRALRDLRLEARALTQLSPDQQLLTIAQALQGVENESLRAQYAFEIFGDSAKALSPLLNAGAGGIQELMAEAQRLGVVMRTEDATAAAQYGDALNRLKRSVGGLKNIIGAALAPTLTRLFDEITKVVSGVSKWMDHNRELVRKVALVTVGAVILGGAIVSLGLTVFVTGVAVGSLATLLGLLAGAVRFLFTPLGALTVGLGLLVAWLIRSGKAVAWLESRFRPLYDEVKVVLQAIRDALIAGDMTAAVRVLWAAIDLAWVQGTRAIWETWLGFTQKFRNSWQDLTKAISEVMIRLTVWDADARDQILQDLAVEDEQQRKRIEDELDRGTAAATNRLQQARKEYEEALAKTAELGERAAREGFADQLQRIMDAEVQLGNTHRMTQQGTFSGLSARMFASTDDAQVRVLKKIEKHTKKMAEETLAFE